MSRHLPPNIPIEKIESIYRTELEKLSDRVIESLVAFFSNHPEESVKSAEIQVFPDEYGEGESSVWMYFEGLQNEKIEKEDKRLIAGKSLELFSDFSGLPTLDLESYEELGYVDFMVSLIKSWFAECWWKAGGWFYPVSVVITGHEDFGDGHAIQLTKQKS